MQALLRLLVGARFQVLFHSPPGVLFTFPSRYWFAIGHRRVFSLGGWSPRLRSGFHVPGPTLEREHAGRNGFAYGTVTHLRSAFPCRFRYRLLCDCAGTGECPDSVPNNPRTATLRRLHSCGFGLLRVRSPLLAQSRLISLPPATEMFQFAGLSSRTLFDSGADGRA